MADDLSTQIRIGADASGVEAGVGRAKRSLADLGGAARRAGKDGGDGLGSIGEGGDKAAQSVERATRNMQNSIQRQIATMQSGSKESASYWEALASQRGVNADALKPYLEQLERVTEETQRAKESTEELGRVADGAGKLLGGVLAAAFAGFTLDKFIEETKGAQQEQAQLEAVLRSTGEAAGWSAERLNMMGEALASKSVFSGGDITQAQTRLLSYTGIVGEQFPRAMQNAIDMAQRMGMDIKSSAETIGRALDIPSEGLTALQRQGFRFSEAQKELVEQLEATGRAGEAQGIILDALEASYGGAAFAARDTLGGSLSALENSINDLMTGGDGSVTGLRTAVDFLTESVGNASTVINALAASSDSAAADLGALATVQEGLAIAFETVAVLGANVAFVLTSVGRELGGLAAQAAAVARLDLGAASAIGQAMKTDAAAARQQVDATIVRILSARKDAEELSRWNARNASANTDPRRLDSKNGAVDETKRLESAEKGLMEIRMRSLGVSKQYSDDLRKLQAGLAAGAITQASYIKEVESLAKSTYKASTAGKGAAESAKSGTAAAKTGAAATKAAAGAYDSLISSIQQKISAEKLELSGGDKLTASQRERIKLDSDLASGRSKLTAAAQASVRAALDELEVLEKQKAAMAEAMKVAQAAAAARTKEADSIAAWMLAQDNAAASALQSATERIASLEEEDKAARLAAATNITLAEAIERTALARLREKQDGFRQGSEGYEALQKEIAARERIIELVQQKGQFEAQQDSNKAMVQEWETAVKQYDDIFRQGFADMLNNGEGAWSSFTKSLKTTFKTTVADQIYKMFAQPFVVKIVASLLGVTGAGAGVASAAAAAGGAGGVGNALSTASTIGSLSSGVGLLGAAGLGAQAGFGALMSSGLAGISASVTGGMAAIASGTGAGIAAGLGTIAGALGPIAAGAALLWQPLFGRKLKDSGIEGSFGGDAGFEGNSYQFLKGGLFRSNKTKRGDLDPGVSDFLSQAFKAFQTQASSFADVLGLEADKVASFTSTIKLSLNGLNEQEIKTALEGALANVSNELAQALLGDNAFGKAGEAAGETLARLAVSLSAANGWFDTLGVTLMDASLAGASAASAFVELFGSMDNFSASMGSYYENFYTEAERMGKATEALAAELGKAGVAMPATKDAYRALVTEQLNAGEAGQELAAKLLQLSPAFAEVADYAAQTAQEARDIARETHELEIELLRAQGKEAEANYRQRMLEIDGLSAAQLVTYDYNAELRKTISAVGKASAALKAFSSAAQSIQTSKDKIAGVVRSPVEIAQNALNASLSQLNAALKPADTIKDDYTYLSLYQDVMAAFLAETAKGGPLAGMSAEEYERMHYASSGKDEGRMSPQEALDYITTLTPNFSGMSLQDVLALDTSAQGDYSAEQWTAIAEVFAMAADLTTAKNTPITPDTPAATAKDGAADAAKLIAQLGTEVSRIGLSALDLQLLEIADSAEQYRQQLKEMEHDTQANIDAVNAWAAAMTDAEKARAKAQADDMLGGLAQQIKELDWIEQEKALYGIDQQTKEYTKTLTELGQATEGNIASVQAWAKAMADAEVARNKAAADNTISGLGREVNELGMTDLQKQMSSISRQAVDYVKGLQDLGQATESNIAAVKAWEDAMSGAAQTAANEAAAKELMDSLSNTTDAAYSALQRAVDAQRSVVQETISHMQAVFDMTRDAAKALYGEVDSARTMTAAAGRAFIDNALSNAKATGYMPDADALRDALADVRNGMQAQQYATSFESDRDRLVLAGKLTDLKELAEPQLTEAQRQLKTLDATLENARQQIDVLRGIDVSVLSVADAVAALAVAIEAERAAKTAAATIAAVTGTTAAPPTTEMPAKPGASYWTPTVVDGRNLFSDPQGYIWDMESIKTAQKLYGAPSFAVGINRVPHDMLAQIHEGEAIVPKAFNPYNPGAKSVGNERLEALVEGLTAEVQRLQSIVAKGVEHQRETAEILDNVTEGGNAMRSEVMA